MDWNSTRQNQLISFRVDLPISYRINKRTSQFLAKFPRLQNLDTMVTPDNIVMGTARPVISARYLGEMVTAQHLDKIHPLASSRPHTLQPELKS